MTHHKSRFSIPTVALGLVLAGFAPAAKAQLAGNLTAVADSESERGTTGRLKVGVPQGWTEQVVEGDVFGLRYTDGGGEDAPTLSLAGDFGPYGTARVALNTLIGQVQTSTPGFSVEETTDIEVPGATSAVRLDFVYGTEETMGVFEGMWIVASDDKTDQSVALALSATEIDDALASSVQSSVVMQTPGGISGAAAPAQDNAEAIAAQDGGEEDGQDSRALATGRHQGGEIIAEVDGLAVDGDRLTVKMALRPAEEGQRVGSNVIYTSLAGQTYEQVYLVSGDKKYMLVRDTNGQPLAPPSLVASGRNAIVGTWYGVFPNPPAGQNITLYMPGMDPLGPFQVPAD